MRWLREQLHTTASRIWAGVGVFVVAVAAVTNAGRVVNWVQGWSHSPSGSVVVLSNGDDRETVLVNGHPFAQVGYSVVKKVDLGHLDAGDRITVRVFNGYGGYTWGIQLRLADKSVYCDRAGEVGLIGAGGNDYEHSNQLVHEVVLTRNGRVLESPSVAPDASVHGPACDEAVRRELEAAKP